MYWWFRYRLRNSFKGWYWKKANQETRHSYQKVTWKHLQLCLNVKFVLVPKGSNRNNTSFVLGSSQLTEKLVALVWQKWKRRKYWRIRGNPSDVTRWFDSNVTHHHMSEVSVLGSVSAFVWLLELTWCSLLQETKPTVLTKYDEKGYLCETYFHKECLSLIGGLKEFEIMVAEFVWAISSTHFSISDWCWWKRCSTNIIAYSFEYNNNRNTFLSPYNALALQINLSGTILDAYCYC